MCTINPQRISNRYLAQHRLVGSNPPVHSLAIKLISPLPPPTPAEVKVLHPAVPLHLPDRPAGPVPTVLIVLVPRQRHRRLVADQIVDVQGRDAGRQFPDEDPPDELAREPAVGEALAIAHQGALVDPAHGVMGPVDGGRWGDVLDVEVVAGPAGRLLLYPEADVEDAWVPVGPRAALLEVNTEVNARLIAVRHGDECGLRRDILDLVEATTSLEKER